METHTSYTNSCLPQHSLERSSQFSQFRASWASTESSFYVLSFLVGFLIVLAVLGIALIYARFRGHKAGEEEEETKLEDEEETLGDEDEDSKA